MSRSPLYVVPDGTEGKSLAGIKPCGCITAAFAVRPPADWPHPNATTEKQVRDFYADMARSGREVRWVDNDVIRARMFRDCDEQHPHPIEEAAA